MGRPKKEAGAKQDKDIRVKLTQDEKTEIQQAAAEDGMEEVSVWLKFLARRRIREQTRERGGPLVPQESPMAPAGSSRSAGQPARTGRPH